ncbi:MAG TPA: gliding motility-associated C-terminal domain-containing protein, partial [Flavisolibacter sp.]
MLIRIFLLLLPVFTCVLNSAAQTYVFAQLTGSPVNTAGWNLQGAATVANVTGTGNTEIRLTPATTNQSGSIFFNQPINLAQCNSWTAEFDFRMYDGSAADGIAFCFLDVPPTGFVSGGGLGIPATATGLKVCFDTYLNCFGSVPKIELRWGAGYDECWAQPTVENSGGSLAFLRSNSYNHAKITYNNGNISVFVNDILYLTGFQQFNFTGYLGFTAATGALTDNHSIKNVIIYTSMPPSEAGADVTICSGQTAQLGTTANLLYGYSWSPATGLSSTTVANPTVTLTNNGNSITTHKYFVNTSYSATPGCFSKDSVIVSVLPEPTLSISTATPAVCSGTTVHFASTAANAGPNPQYQWFVNGVASGTGTTFSSATLDHGDVVTCQVTPGNICGVVTSNSVTITINPSLVPSVTISAPATTICPGGSVTFTAQAVDAGSAVVYQWTKNGVAAGGGSSQYTVGNLVNGDVIQCTITGSGPCVSSTPVESNTITINTFAVPQVNLGNDTSFCSGGSVLLQAGSYTSYSWNTGATTPQIMVTSAGTYAVEATTVDGCISKDTLQVISVFPNPVVSLGSSSALCDGSTRTLQPGTFSSYLWNTGSSASQLTVSAPGTYSVQVTDANGCAGTGSVTITGLIALPAGFLPADTAICSYGTMQLAASGNFTSHNWNTGATTQAITITQPGAYWLTVTGPEGCSGTDTVTVEAKDCLRGFYAPTAFTPNGDGRNDVFRPLLFGRISHYRFSIYNRWGQLIF